MTDAMCVDVPPPTPYQRARRAQLGGVVIRGRVTGKALAGTCSLVVACETEDLSPTLRPHFRLVVEESGLLICHPGQHLPPDLRDPMNWGEGTKVTIIIGEEAA